MKKIGFPGFGWEFEIDSTAFEIFGLKIQWYGIIISLGIVLSFILFYRLATKKEQISGDTVYNITLLTVPIAIIGARFVYVATRWDVYKGTGFWNIINIRGGGLAIYGAVIFGLATVLVYNKIKKQSSLSVLDAMAPAVMLGQIIGRWGNFFNGEAYGWTENVESFPWRMWLEKVTVDGEDITEKFGHCVHPTFLYESLWNLIGLAIILAVFYRKKKFNGQIFCAYMGWYGFGRFFIEMIRADSLYIGGLKFSVLVGALCFITAVICAFIFAHRGKIEKEELEDYQSSFAAARIAAENEGDSLDQSIYDVTDPVDDTDPNESAIDETEPWDDEVLPEEEITGEAEENGETGEEAAMSTEEAGDQGDFIAGSEVLNASRESEEMTGGMGAGSESENGSSGK
ncbi:MAG: prolipoprotein diacylglyceryl transferase [Clostridia bacterium]|nr:prolipoprotein diacylglyceryl transferase [Clostridia bacterium]MBR4799511.1 prolipoprotein diacylglyceryl transferase [Clostridia bacterium]